MAELAAALAAAVLYWPVLGFGFVFDDRGLIGADGSPTPLGAGLPYRPIRFASYLVDAWLGGSPSIYHFDNLLLHSLVAALVVALARRAGAGRAAAAAGGLLLAFHPLAVEAAAYVSGRRDLLAVAFGLAAMLAMDAGRAAAAALLLLAATGAKESGLVFAAPLLAMVAMRAPGPWRVQAVAAVLAAAAASIAMALAYGAIGPWTLPTTASAVAFSGFVAAHYLTGFLGLRPLAPDYPALMDLAANLRGGDPAMLAIGGAVSALLLGAAIRVMARLGAARGDRPVFLAGIWILVVMLALATAGGLHEPGVDRHAYLLLPAAGFALALALERLRRAARARRSPVFAFVALMLVAAAWASRMQMQVWSSEGSLWTHAASQPRVSVRTHANLARVLAEAGDYRQARVHLDAALAVDSRDPSLYLSRAAVSCASDRRSKARGDLDRARALGAADETVAVLAADCPLPRLAEVLRGAPPRTNDAARARVHPENAS